MNCVLEEQLFGAVQEKNTVHYEQDNNVTADQSNPPTPKEKKEANDTSYDESSSGMVQPAAVPSAGSQLQTRGTCHDQFFGCG